MPLFTDVSEKHCALGTA